MKRPAGKHLAVLSGAVALAAVAWGGHISLPATAAPQGSRWNAEYFTNTEVVSHEGKTLRFYDDLLKDRIFVVNFVFTSCSQLCPLTTARLAEVQQKLGDRVGRDIFFYSITLDPMTDTAEKLKAFADGFKIGPGWLFLTGDPDNVKLVRDRLGERSRDKGEHQATVFMSNNRTGEWLKDSAMSEPDHLVEAILSLDPEYRDKVHSVGANLTAGKTVMVKNVRGHNLFMKACSTCHTIGGGDRIGPDLAGVTARRDRSWLTRFISRPDKLREEGDGVATELGKKYSGVLMPFLGLTETDAEDALSYIESESARKSAAR